MRFAIAYISRVSLFLLTATAARAQAINVYSEPPLEKVTIYFDRNAPISSNAMNVFSGGAVCVARKYCCRVNDTQGENRLDFVKDADIPNTMIAREILPLTCFTADMSYPLVITKTLLLKTFVGLKVTNFVEQPSGKAESEESERKLIQQALTNSHGDTASAAKKLRISERALLRKIQQLHVTW